MRRRPPPRVLSAINKKYHKFTDSYDFNPLKGTPLKILIARCQNLSPSTIIDHLDPHNRTTNEKPLIRLSNEISQSADAL
jgi:hypothetical protein